MPKAIVVNGIRTERGKYLFSTPAGARIFLCTVYNTKNGDFKNGVIFETDKLIDIVDHIPEWIIKEQKEKTGVI
jgi:hypothetical protein